MTPIKVSDDSHYIFLIWEKARNYENFLIEKISENFIINEIYEISWTPKKFPNNLRRFYGPGKVGDVNKKTELCGTGSFLLIIISDPNPIFDKRRTSKGMELVNINLFDKKKEFRTITKKGYAIHSSITPKETNDDVTLLLGINLNDLNKKLPKNWDRKIKSIKCDLIGENGWKNLEEMFYVLNSTINYLVFRNFEELGNTLSDYNHNDIDILTDDFLRIPYITNGGKSSFNNIFPKYVKISDKKIILDFSYPQDGYYDIKWYKKILENRELCNNFYIPSKEDYFYSLFYHAIFHQKKFAIDYKNKLLLLSKELDYLLFTKNIFDNIDNAEKFLEAYMKKNKFSHPNSLTYKIIHNRINQLIDTSLLIWKTQGFNFLIYVTKEKIKRIVK